MAGLGKLQARATEPESSVLDGSLHDAGHLLDRVVGEVKPEGDARGSRLARGAVQGQGRVPLGHAAVHSRVALQEPLHLLGVTREDEDRRLVVLLLGHLDHDRLDRLKANTQGQG